LLLQDEILVPRSRLLRTVFESGRFLRHTTNGGGRRSSPLPKITTVHWVVKVTIHHQSCGLSRRKTCVAYRLFSGTSAGWLCPMLADPKAAVLRRSATTASNALDSQLGNRQPVAECESRIDDKSMMLDPLHQGNHIRASLGRRCSVVDPDSMICSHVPYMLSQKKKKHSSWL
jgi:hypothetical protein